MHFLTKFTLLIALTGVLITSCKKDPEIDIVVSGCKDPLGDNYNANASVDDGTCSYQKRFISQYEMGALCGATNSIFSDATMEIKEHSKKNRVNFNIGASVGNFIFDGVITKDSVKIDTILKGIVVNAQDFDPVAFPDVDIKADITLKSIFVLSQDGKKLAGDLLVYIITTESFFLNGAEITAGKSLEDTCAIVGTKK